MVLPKSTHNRPLHGEIRKIFTRYPLLSGAMNKTTLFYNTQTKPLLKGVNSKWKEIVLSEKVAFHKGGKTIFDRTASLTNASIPLNPCHAE